MAGWRLEHTYASLPASFHSEAKPTPVADPRMVMFNRALAAALGLDADALMGPRGAAVFGGNFIPEGARPIAQAYAGHQFGHFTVLGDGRAILLGEQVTPGGDRMDIQLKGAGQTRYSRRGDGRAALGPMLREYIISEAMHALRIPTTRSLAVVATGEPVYRETVLPGAVLTRVASSHIRVGTMQWAAFAPGPFGRGASAPRAASAQGASAPGTAENKDAGLTRALADYTLARHYPEFAAAGDRYFALFEQIVARQASLIARWQLVGFIHGVMNTDNMALSGETIDYGPCAFMDAYDPATVFSSIDQGGRYAYGNQPAIAQWNLARLAESMLPLFDPHTERAVERATAVLAQFATLFYGHWLDGMRAKLGLFTREDEDEALVNSLLASMRAQSADFTNTFRALTNSVGSCDRSTAEGSAQRRVCADLTSLEPWLATWHARRGRQPQTAAESEALMRRHNPAFIPRNHRVEEALLAATSSGELSVVEKLLDVLADPFNYDRDEPKYTEPGTNPGDYRTFCGT